MVRILEEKQFARVGLLGNPNTGKSTVFNRLTGLRQRIANYPGITVEERVGLGKLGDRPVEWIDLPGTYSLAGGSADEKVVLDALTARDGRRPLDLLVFVLDATNLERNLFLPFQVADFGLPMVIALNQWDVARKRKLMVDPTALSERLGIPVVPVSARNGEGFAEFSEVIRESLEKPRTLKTLAWPEPVEEAVRDLREYLPDLGRGEAVRLFFDPREAHGDRAGGHAERIHQTVAKGRTGLERSGLNPGPAEALLQYDRIRQVLADSAPSDEVKPVAAESVDRILLHRFWGLGVFVAVMWVVFQSVYTWAGPIMDGMESLTGWVQGLVSPLLASTPLLQSLVVDGVIAGVGGVIIFLPQIFILFLFIGLLEETGYMARAAFLMDKALSWCGLNGKSFVPLLSSYACAIPGVMAARTLENRWARTVTILMAPFMSCSARLPVYVLLIGAFIEPRYGAMAAGWALFFMHFVGLLVSAPLAWLAYRFAGRDLTEPFILEMPDYKIPHVRNLLIRMWESGREFLVRAGTVIFAFSVIIWALLFFPRSESVENEVTRQVAAEWAAESPGMTVGAAEAALRSGTSPVEESYQNRLEAAWMEDSYMGRFGHWVQPIFAPAGFDWKITVGVLSSFPARELIVSTLGIIYNMGPEVDEESAGLREKIASEKWQSGPHAGQPIYSMPVVWAVMIFFALCMQCGATVVVIAKELNKWYALGSFVGMTVLAWVGAVLVYQVGMLL